MFFNISKASDTKECLEAQTGWNQLPQEKPSLPIDYRHSITCLDLQSVSGLCVFTQFGKSHLHLRFTDFKCCTIVKVNNQFLHRWPTTRSTFGIRSMVHSLLEKREMIQLWGKFCLTAYLRVVEEVLRSSPHPDTLRISAVLTVCLVLSSPDPWPIFSG